MEAKKFILEYVKELSNAELLDAVKDRKAWRETGKCLFPQTVADDIYEMYFKPIGHIGTSGMISAHDVICREVAERVVDGLIK